MPDLKRLFVIGGLLSLLAHWVVIDLWRGSRQGQLRLNSPTLMARLVRSGHDDVEPKSGDVKPPLAGKRASSSQPNLRRDKALPLETTQTFVPIEEGFAPSLARGVRPWSEAESMIAYRLALANIPADWQSSSAEPIRVAVHLSIDEGGQLSDVRLAGTAVDSAFGQSILAWTAKAVRFARLPEDLRGRAFEMELVLEL